MDRILSTRPISDVSFVVSLLANSCLSLLGLDLSPGCSERSPIRDSKDTERVIFLIYSELGPFPDPDTKENFVEYTTVQQIRLPVNEGQFWKGLEKIEIGSPARLVKAAIKNSKRGLMHNPYR